MVALVVLVVVLVARTHLVKLDLVALEPLIKELSVVMTVLVRPLVVVVVLVKPVTLGVKAWVVTE
jgi:hypothetical protein